MKQMYQGVVDICVSAEKKINGLGMSEQGMEATAEVSKG